MFFHPVKQSRFGWNVKFNHCDMLWIGFQFQRQSKHLTTGILGMKIGMYLLRLGHSLALLDWRMIYSIGLCMVDVDLLTYGLGLWQVLIKLPAAFGLCMSMENILNAIGLRVHCMVNIFSKLGLQLHCMVNTFAKLGLRLRCMVNLFAKLGHLLRCMVIIFATLGLRRQCLEKYMDKVGLSMVQRSWVRIYMTVGLHALATFHGMVWGEVEQEMELFLAVLWASGMRLATPRKESYRIFLQNHHLFNLETGFN